MDDAGAEREFDFTSGALCLDFSNSAGSRDPRQHQQMAGSADLLAWGAQAGLLSDTERGHLEARWLREPAEAAARLARALALRELLYDLFSRRVGGRRPSPVQLAALNRMVPAALGQLRIRPAARGFTWARDGAVAGDAVDVLLGSVVTSAALLLTTPQRLERLRECDGERCQWLFLDRSRNGRRRWCDMSSCGNRAKARRHYQKTRAGGGSEAG